MVSETVEAEGHLIDSGNFQAILTTVVEHGSEYEILRFDVGRNNAQGSHLILQLTSDTDARLQDLLSKLSVFGCFVKDTPDVVVRPADLDGAAPPDFYSTTNHRTSVFMNGAWVDVENQRMDAALVVENPKPQNPKTSKPQNPKTPKPQTAYFSVIPKSVTWHRVPGGVPWRIQWKSAWHPLCPVRMGNGGSRA